MSLRSGSIPGFRQLMQQSISRFYSQRGLSGPDLHAFKAQLQATADHLRGEGASKDQVKAALVKEQARYLAFPVRFSTEPEIGETFKIVDDQGAPLTDLQPGFKSVAGIAQQLSDTAHSAIVLKGSVGMEGHYAGMGTRLESKKAKFIMTGRDLLEGLGTFEQRIHDPKFSQEKLYQTLAAAISDEGGMDAIKNRFIGLKKWTIGERIFLAKLFAIYELARNKFQMSDNDFRDIIKKLKFKIVINEESGGAIIENFVKMKFFGLDPRNIFFMRQAQHPTLDVDEEGNLVPDENRPSQGNHGLITFQSVLDKQWFVVVPDEAGGYREEKVAYVDYKDMQAGIEILMVENVEDTAQYLTPYNWPYIGTIGHYGPLGFTMFMQIVGNKRDNPQKGGFLAKTQPIEGTPRNVVIESNRAPSLIPADISFLNENKNGLYRPGLVEDEILSGKMFEDLHPTFEPQGKDFAVRIDPKIPQGDRNLYLRTLYLKSEREKSISNLKDPVDILPTLRLMLMMDANPRLLAFARDFLGLD